MKAYKKIFVACLIVLIGSSCEDFLEESNKIGKTEDTVYNTAEALEGLVATCYGFNKGAWGKETMVALGEIGTDLWNDAADPRTSRDFNIYENMNPEMDFPIDQVMEFWYMAINTCNLAISKVTASDLLPADKKIHLECEARFLRSFYYWHIVETWGPMQLNEEEIKDASTTSRRDSEQEIYEFMFDDLNYCIANLPEDEAPSSYISWLAAKAFKARLALYYAGDYYKNQVKVDYKGEDYYAIALQEAQDVITASASLGKGLYSSYADVWDIDKSYTPLNDEFIWAVDYYDEISASNPYNFVPTRARVDEDGNQQAWANLFVRLTDAGGGNCQHLWLTPRFYSQTHGDGGPSLADLLHRVAGEHENFTEASDSTKVTVDVGHWYVKYMGYGKFGPSRFAVELFDETIDQRWEVSFITAWYKHPEIVPKYYYSAPSKCLYPNMSVGTETDTALFYSKHPLTQAQIDRAEGRYKILSVDNTYEADGTPKVGGQGSSTHIFPHFAKFINTQSTIELPADNFTDYYSKRDFPLFRLAEAYLIAAEAALLGGGGASSAYPFIQTLADARAFNGDGSTLLESYGVTSADNVDLDFILDERAREFIGEDFRWFDLKRTMKLEERVMAHNIMARPHFDRSKHYLRPIPAIQMNTTLNSSLIIGEGFWQNPGY